MAAVEALSGTRDARAVQPLSACLRDSEPSVRAAAAATLGVIGDPGCVAGLFKAVTDGHWNVRKAAVDALARIKDPQSVEALTPLLQDPDHDVREATCRALAQIRERRAIEWRLVAALTDSQTAVRQAAAAALKLIEPQWEKSDEARRAIPHLKSSLKEREYWVRHSAADALRRIENADPESSAISHPLDERRNAAFIALITVVGSGHPDLRQAAVEALGRIGDPRAIPTLQPLLVEQDKWVRNSVAEALRQLGHQPSTPFPSTQPQDAAAGQKDVYQAAA